MIAIDFNDLEKMISNEEEIIIKRKNEDENLIILNLKKYNELIEKVKKLEYWNRIDNGRKEKGDLHKLIEVDDNE